MDLSCHLASTIAVVHPLATWLHILEISPIHDEWDTKEGVVESSELWKTDNIWDVGGWWKWPQQPGSLFLSLYFSNMFNWISLNLLRVFLTTDEMLVAVGGWKWPQQPGEGSGQGCIIHNLRSEPGLGNREEGKMEKKWENIMISILIEDWGLSIPQSSCNSSTVDEVPSILYN